LSSTAPTWSYPLSLHDALPILEALKSVQPEDLPATDIDVRLGASWMPPDDVSQFIQALLNLLSVVEISHIHALGAWHVNGDWEADRKSTRLNSSHQIISYAVFC